MLMIIEYLFELFVLKEYIIICHYCNMYIGEKEAIRSNPNNTTIELQVADGNVGAILGKKGVTLESIIQLSGAQIIISSRDNANTNKQTMRTVTIVGSPLCAQAAHTLIVHRLQQDASDTL